MRDFEFRAYAEPDASLFGNLDGSEDAFEVAFKVEGVLVQAARGDGDEPTGGMHRCSCACPVYAYAVSANARARRRWGDERVETLKTPPRRAG